MSAEVQLYFPDAPERCLTCPALEAAATRIDQWYMLNSTVTEQRLEAGSFEDDAAVPMSPYMTIVSMATAQEITRLQNTCAPIARELYTACETGPTNQDGEQAVQVRGLKPGRLGTWLQKFLTVQTEKYISYRACASAAPVAMFAPSKYHEAIPHHTLEPLAWAMQPEANDE